MQIDAQTAVVDNDFISHLVASKLSNDHLVEVINIVFSDLELSAVMHPLVYQNELLKDTPRIKLLFDAKVVYKAEFEDIFQDDPDRKAYYIFLIKELYRALMGESLPVSGENVLTHWARRKSLGEIHSITMCLLCECGIFLSDDRDSKALKEYVDRKALGKIDVYSRNEFMHKHMVEGETKLNRKERQALTHSSSH